MTSAQRARQTQTGEEALASRADIPEEHLAPAIEAAGLGVFDFDPATGRAFVSDLARKHLGMPFRAELSLQDFFECLNPEDRDRVTVAIDRALRSEDDEGYAEEFRVRNVAPGEERWIASWGRALRDATGSAVRFAGVVRDVTATKLAERDNYFHMQLTACISEQSADSMILTDLNGRTRFANPAAQRVFGYSFEEFQSQHIHDLLHHHHPDGRPYPAEECRRTHELARGVPRDYEDVFFHKDGTQIDVAVSCAPFILNGVRDGVVFAIRDVRERRKAESELRKSDARFRRLFDADMIAIMVVEGDYITEANDHLIEMLGYTRDQIGAQKLDWRSLTAPEQIAATERAIRSISETGVRWPFENEYVRRDGSRVPVLFAGVELNPGGPSQVLCFAVDLREQKSLEIQVRQAQRLESIGLLAGGVAHDFNNLLTVILGYADMARSDLPEQHPLAEPVAQIQSAADRAAALTRQLLTFSRRNSGEPKKIALRELVDNVAGMLRRLIGEDIEVIVTAEGDRQFIHADPALVEQVILNLAVNGRDAMPDGGQLRIETSSLTVAEGLSAPQPGMEPGTWISLTVTDTGTGMTPEVQARLFEPFFTTKEPGKGTGLGLSTVYGIVKQSNGAIMVHSAPGLGTSVRVFFPAVLSGEAPSGAVTEKPVVDGTETVLLVEDEGGVRNYVRRVLEAHGYRALDASRGEDALRLAQHFQGKIDLLLTDVVLPGMKGAEVIERIREIRPDVAVLRMSGYPDRFGAQAGDNSPHLQKPFTPEKLLQRVRSVLDESQAG